MAIAVLGKWSGGGRRQAFALAELLISVVLASLLAVTVGLAVYRCGYRVDETRTVLARRHVEREILKNVVGQLRVATDIQALSASGITFTTLGPGGAPETVTYRWDDTTYQVLRKVGTGTWQLVADAVYDFSFEADVYNDGDKVRARQVSVSILVGPDEVNRMYESVELLNDPEVNFGSVVS